MAQLSNVRFRALDANNAIVSGAGLFIYEEGSTSSLASIYTDAGLTTPASNPLTSYTNGYFPQFYIAEGLTVDVYARQTTSVGSTLLWQALSVDSVGNEAVDTFYRDFGANGRLQAVGTGGLVRLEFGDPVGDDAGGDAVVSGWGGTDLTSYEHRGPMHITGDLHVAGDLEVDGAITKAPHILSSGSASAAASFEIALPSGYTQYKLEIRYLGLSTNAYVQAVLAFDAVPTYKTGGGDYVGAYAGIAAGNMTISEQAAGPSMILCNTTSSAVTSTLGSNAQVDIISAAGKETSLSGQVNIWDGSSKHIPGPFFSATNAKNYGKATYVKLSANTGTITAEYTLYGVPTSV